MTIVDNSSISTGDTDNGFPLPAQPPTIAFHVNGASAGLNRLTVRVLGGFALMVLVLESLDSHVYLNKML